jgi:glycosyltransferase involved in cell wall biosynthesis
VRVLIWGVFPGIPSGYGKQCGHLAEAAQAAGHDVAILAYHGLAGKPATWNGMPVYPGGRDDWANDVIAADYQHWKADALLGLGDIWCLSPEALSGHHLNMAFLTPIDCDPLGAPDESVLRRTHALPLAMSRFGYRMMEDAYFKPRYMPHGIDTAVFEPMPDHRRAEMRAGLGLEDRFVIGINAANADGTRKGYGEQFQAFAEFHAKHPDAVLLVHTLAENTRWGGVNLRALAAKLGITDHVQFADQHSIINGLVDDSALAAWYGALDVLSNCSRGEGFGLPIIEAQACGTPVVVTNASSMPELAGSGWKVPGQRVWHDMHQAFWTIPDVDGIAAAWEKARAAGGRKRAQAREFALGYDVKTVAEKYWLPVLDELASRTA